jgi:hypothetical protein
MSAEERVVSVATKVSFAPVPVTASAPVVSDQVEYLEKPLKFRDLAMAFLKNSFSTYRSPTFCREVLPQKFGNSCNFSSHNKKLDLALYLHVTYFARCDQGHICTVFRFQGDGVIARKEGSLALVKPDSCRCRDTSPCGRVAKPVLWP